MWRGFNPRIREGCDINPCIYFMVPAILIHASARDATKTSYCLQVKNKILIHASARDATAKSYKIGNNFTVLFRKFVQKFDIVTFYISIF